MSTVPAISASEPEPVWDLATLYPPQGAWTEDDYLSLTDSTNRLIELTDGRLEFLPMPSEAHQLILAFLFEALRDFVRAKDAGLVLFAGLRVRIRDQKIREPDLVFLAQENYSRRGPRYWSGADLVMEVVSAGDESRERDHQKKVADYAEAGIAEYWIVDPQKQQVTLLALPDGGSEYVSAGTFGPGETVASRRLIGFTLDVTSAFDAANA
jgi:Uma2 family endonuclease